MPRRAKRGSSRVAKRAPSKRKSSRRWRLSSWWPSAQTRRRCFKLYCSAPAGLQIAIALIAVGVGWLTANWIYQVVRKPSELFFPVSGVLYRSPSETWETYAPIFRRHSTATVTPELLAALAQIEGSGNPIVRTYWRWSLRSDPFEVYRPASSAVGMYQITDGTFEDSRRFCIHDHVVVEDGPWNDWKSCWFNSLYTRTVPSHAVELTSAHLDRNIAAILARHRVKQAGLKQKHELATLIHLCGAGAGNRFASRGFRLAAGQRCGDHSAQGYLTKVERMKRVFQRMGALDEK